MKLNLLYDSSSNGIILQGINISFLKSTLVTEANQIELRYKILSMSTMSFAT